MKQPKVEYWFRKGYDAAISGADYDEAFANEWGKKHAPRKAHEAGVKD